MFLFIAIRITDHEYATMEKKSDRRASLQPRYVGDVRTPHLETPRRARKCFLMSKKVIETQKKTITKLTQELRRVREKV